MGAAPQLQETWPIIDPQKLQVIKNLSAPHDEDGFFRELLGIFFQRCSALLEELAKAVDNQDAVQLERAAHALKGTAGNLGAIMMMKLSEHLEALGRSGKIASADAYVLELKKAYMQTEKVLKDDWLS